MSFKSILLLLSFITILCLVTRVQAEDLSITGFADFLSSYQSGSQSFDDFRFGQVELDLSASQSDQISIEGALAYDPDDQAFGLGAFIIDFHFSKETGDHLHNYLGIDHTGILAGQFDVPFGLDWEVYPSIDRKFVTSPLVADRTHQVWNDTGVQIYAGSRYFDAVLYYVNGFDYEIARDSSGEIVGYHSIGYDSDDPQLQIENHQIRNAAGGRFGVRPTNYTEIGVSYAGSFSDGPTLEMNLIGIDLQLEMRQLLFKGEYISHSFGINSVNERRNSGYYGQLIYQPDNWFMGARYGFFHPESDIAGDETHICLLSGYSIAENCEIRIEHSIHREHSSDVTYLQLVVGF